jgi:hypothetical protein
VLFEDRLDVFDEIDFAIRGWRKFGEVRISSLCRRDKTRGKKQQRWENHSLASKGEQA